MTAPYSWFSITITKMCEKVGTAAGAGAGGGAAWVEAGGLVGAAAARVAAGVGTQFAPATRRPIWALWASLSPPDSAAYGRGTPGGVAFVFPRTRAGSPARTPAAPIAPFS